MLKFDDKLFIGNIIRAYRKKLNMTQEELAEKTDLSVQHISRIEIGKYIPSLKSFFEIVKVLNIDLSVFGLNTLYSPNLDKKELIEKILIATDKELIFYKNMISAIQNTLKDME